MAKPVKRLQEIDGKLKGEASDIVKYLEIKKRDKAFFDDLQFNNAIEELIHAISVLIHLEVKKTGRK